MEITVAERDLLKRAMSALATPEAQALCSKLTAPSVVDQLRTPNPWITALTGRETGTARVRLGSDYQIRRERLPQGGYLLSAHGLYADGTPSSVPDHTAEVVGDEDTQRWLAHWGAVL